MTDQELWHWAMNLPASDPNWPTALAVLDLLDRYERLVPPTITDADELPVIRPTSAVERMLQTSPMTVAQVKALSDKFDGSTGTPPDGIAGKKTEGSGV
jgi:hypothetical protein